jgi:hypothetical protein
MTTYYRTTKGNHRHADFECANQKRQIHNGVEEIPATEVADWAPCDECCDEGQVREHAAKAAAQAATKCQGRPAKPRHIQSKCTECAHVGTSRSWKAHTPK